MSERQYYEAIAVTVEPGEDGVTVRRLLERRLGVSRKLLSRLKMTEEGLTLNGERVYTSHKVKTGDVVALRMEAERSDDIMPQPMDLSIVYEDAYLLIVNKPVGIVVHPTHGHYTGTLANGVVHHWQEKGESVRFRPVHRLDQDTSGVVAIAKNGYIHQQLSEQLQRGEVDKAYIAYVYGTPDPRQGTVNEPIDRNPDSPHVRIVTPTGYPSVTHYETVEVYRSEAAAKIRLKLETGRTHQIRVHMQHVGCPLAGDRMYGLPVEAMGDWMLDAEEAAGRQALHAAELALTHPMTGERMRFEAALPADLERLEAYLRSER